ncbi:MAG TPA: hypothetical protein VMA74_00005 [Dyella sp.]|uniref:hypothetical protein n=1 Tax=Dyella sp. TaxID=1869338 RepID=UPI002C691856|nr:hypothetical protein [Dyella sp.]HUB88086.1 hypothetical protein [Dyella sp.]
MRAHRSYALAWSVLLASTASALAGGSTTSHSMIPHALTAADRTAIQHYTLSEDAFQKLLATAKDAKANQVPIDIVDPHAHSLDETAAHLEHSADFRALIARHGLTTRNFLLGEYALLSAEFAVKYAGQPNFDASLANPANVALYRRHEAELDALSGDDVNN